MKLKLQGKIPLKFSQSKKEKLMRDLETMSARCKEFTILYVEDDLQTQESFSKTLRRLFKDVLVGNDGEMGLKLFHEHRPDLVITDIQMPRMNGLDMAKSIKECAPLVPVIVITAFNEEHHFIEAIENGVDAFLFKPIEKEKLFDTLFKHTTHLLNQKKSQELEELKKINEINKISEESIQSLANLFPFPALFYKANQLIFINTEATKMLERVAIDSIVQETLLVSQFQITKDSKQKIKIPTHEGVSKAYCLYPNAFFMGVDFELVQVYIFVDMH